MGVYIGFSKPKKFKIGSWAIKTWMNTPYSHVYLRVYSKYTEQDLVYQASHGMVNCMSFEVFRQNNVIVSEFYKEISPENLRNCVKKAQQLLGKPYGYLAVLRIALKELGLDITGDGTKTYVCSEFIARLFPEFFKEDADFIQPKTLFEALA